MKTTLTAILAVLLSVSLAYAEKPKAHPAPEPWNGVRVELFPAELDGKWGFVNRYGHLVIEPQYEAAWDFTEGLARVQVNGLRGFVDRTGKMVIEPKYHVAWAFNEGLAAVMVPKSRFGGNVNKWEWEYLYRDGGTFKKVNGTWAGDWHEGKTRIKTHAGSGYAMNAYESKAGRRYQFYRGPRDFHEGRAGVEAGRGKYGYFNHSMRYVIPGRFDGIRDFSEGLAAVKVDKKWGYIDPFGNFVIEPAYEDARPFADGLAAVKVEGTYGCVDRAGTMVIKPGFDFIAPFSEGRARVVVGGKHGFIDRSGETVVEPKYDGGWEFSKGLARVLVGEREDYVDATGAAVWDDARREACRAALALKDAASCRAHIKGAGDPYARGAGLARLAALDGEKALDDLLAAAKNDDPSVRGTASVLLGILPGDGVTAKLAEQMKAAAPVVKAGLLGALAVRGDGSALDAAKEQIKDADPVVRLAAIRAVARIGGKDMVPDLVPLLQAENAGERMTAAGELVRMSWQEAAAAVADAVTAGQSDVRVYMIESLASKRAAGNAGAVVAAAKDEHDDVRRAALDALYFVAGEAQLPALIELVAGAKSDEERGIAEAALREVAGREVQKPDDAAAMAVKKIAEVQAPGRSSLLRALGKMGGEKGMKAVEAALKDEDEAVRTTALQVLAAWPDPAAAPVLLRIARESEDEKQKNIAAGGFMRVVRMRARRTTEQTLELCRGGFEIARDANDKKALLGMLGWVRDIRTIQLLSEHLEDEGVENDVGRTLIGIAAHTYQKNPEETKTALQKVVDLGKVTDKRSVKSAEDLLAKIDKK